MFFKKRRRKLAIPDSLQTELNIAKSMRENEKGIFEEKLKECGELHQKFKEEDPDTKHRLSTSFIDIYLMNKEETDTRDRKNYENNIPRAENNQDIKFSISISEDKDENSKYRLSSNNEINKYHSEILKTELKPSFKDILFKYIDQKGLTDPIIYKKAKVSRKTFSKIRTGTTKYVTKKTAIRLGLALHLNILEFTELLQANNNILYENNYFDVAIRWCINNNIYDIDQVNDILYACDLKLLTEER